MNYKFALIFLILLICSVGIGSATDYYVSLSGNNTNNGTTLNSSWLTWAHATDTTVAGDTTWIVDGTYEESYVQFTNSGTDGNPIVLRAYNGTPSINGTRASNERGFYISSKSWIEIYGLETYDFAKGIDIRQSNNISVYNHSSHDNGNNTPYGIFVLDCDYIHIENGTFFNNYNGIAAYNSNFITVDNVQSYDNDMGGVFFYSTNNSIVENSHTWGTNQDYGITANYGDNIIFRYNVVNYSENHGIGFQFGTSNSIIEYNVITDSEESIHVGDGDDLPVINIADNNTVKHNVIYGITEEAFHALYGVRVKTGATNTTVYNNTIDNIGNVSNSASIYLSHAGINNNFYDNTILNNSYWAGAIRLLNSSNSTFTSNVVNADATWKYYLETSNYTEIYDESQSIKLKFNDALSSGLITYTDGSVFSVSGTVDGDIPIYHNINGSSTLLLSGTAQTITSNISNRNIKIKPFCDYIQDIIVNTNNLILDIYNVTINSSVPENPCWINITVNKPSNTYKIERDDTYYDSVISDSNSIMRYNYDILGSEWSEHLFTITNANNEFVGTHIQTGTNTQNNITNLNLIQDYNTSNVNLIDCSFIPATTEPSKNNYIMSLNPVGYWKLGDDLLDYSGNGHNGTENGVGISSVIAKYDNGTNFSENGGYISFGTDNMITNSSEMSLIMYVNISSFDNQFLFSKGQYTQPYRMIKVSFNRLVWDLTTVGTTSLTTSVDAFLPYYNKLTQLMFIYDGSNMYIYINNVEEDSMPCTGQINVSAYDTRIGYWGSGYNSPVGSVDNAILLDYALNESQRNNLYYDYVQQLQTKTNSSTEYSTLWNSTADNPSSVPFGAGKILSYLEFSIPPSTIVDNITISDYNTTAQFIPSSSIVFTEPIVAFDSAINNVFTLNISHTSTLNATSGYIRYITLNDSLLNAAWVGNATLNSDNPNATLVFDGESYFNITTRLLSNTDVFQYNITLPYIETLLPPQNLTSITNTDQIYFNWDDYESADYWNISQLDITIPFTSAYAVLDGIKDACYTCCCAYAFVGDSPNPYTTYGKETIYILRNDTYLILYADGGDNDGLSQDDKFSVGIDASNNNLTTDDRKFILGEGGTVTAKRWSGSSWLPQATNAQGVVIGAGTPGAIQYEMFIPVSELDTNFTNGSTVKFFMSRIHTGSNPDVESYYPQTLQNDTDATLWQSVLLSSEPQYTYINNTTISEYTVTGLDPFTWYQHRFTAINGSQESSGVNSADITLDTPSYTISGYIKDSSGNPIANADVWGENGYPLEHNVSNASGYYTGTHFHNGTHTIYANATNTVQNSISVTVSGVNLTNQNITLNYDNFTFTDISATSPIKDGETSTVLVDVTDFDGTIQSVVVKIEGANYTMQNTVGNTWRYFYTDTSIIKKHYITDIYAQDTASAWNSTTSSLYIDVVSAAGEGNGGGFAPFAIPELPELPDELPEIPLPSVEELVPIITNITESINETIHLVGDIISADGISMLKLNTDVGEVKFVKEIERIGAVDCSSSDPMVQCGVLNDKVIIIVIPDLKGSIYNQMDSHVSIEFEDGTLKYTKFTVIVLDAMGYLVINPFFYDNPNPYLFEVEPSSDAVVGVRYWWPVSIGLVGMFVGRRYYGK